ncbi:hypothetical protein ACJVDH_19615 [Pedobacter sp. AW1-32]|uniref:hypothetical protein n=1 Tax=Pedobacter sp. AW1-32 TaxID=3383026 RepID=UPI003FEF406C
MLLGATKNTIEHKPDEEFIVQLMLQSRFAEAYLLLKQSPQNHSATAFNLAICVFHSKNYEQAILHLEQARQNIPQSLNPKPLPDHIAQNLIDLQKETEDYLQPLSQKYASAFSEIFRDHIIRLQTDCWLLRQNWQKTVETAKPIEHKNYRNVINALRIAIPKLSSL